MSPSAIETLRSRAAETLRPHQVEYVPETGEYIVTLPPGRTENDFAAELMATGDYEYAVPDWLCFAVGTIPNDPSYGMQWHHPKVRSPQAWDIQTGDPSLIIAIVDGGVQLDHPDLAGALVPGYNSKDRLAQSAGGEVGDVDGHGTYVAGLAGAVGDNGVHVVGMGWNFSLMPIRYYNSPGGGYLSDVLDGARWAVDHGARCINVSQTGVEYAPVQTTGEYIRGQGGLLFWAAGNDGRDLSWFDWPDVIVVGATDSSDQMPSWSAFGLAVDVFAPGAEVISTAMPSGLGIGNGTSASTPIAAGICGLLWSQAPLLQPAQVESCLFAGCLDLGDPGNDIVWGWGRVDSYASLAGWPPLAYCTSKVASTGLPASISYSGTPSHTSADFQLIGYNGGVGKTFGIHIYSDTGPASTPFNNGTLCLAAPIVRGPLHQYDSLGLVVVQIPIDISQIGKRRLYQLWFRDKNHPDGTGVGLTDGLDVTFHP